MRRSSLSDKYYYTMLDITRKDKLTVVANAEQQNKKERFIGSAMPHKGQKVFELDKSTGNICIAEFEKTTANFPLKSSDGVGVNKKILAKENCIYVLAINLLNAFMRNHPNCSK